jgi:quercetin dioxygenase-like cupin family protein
MRYVTRVLAGAAFAAFLATAIGAAAQAPAAPGFKRIPVQQGELSIPGKDVVQAVAEFSAGGESGKHTHPGEEIAYILEGAISIEIQGKPAVTKKAGEGMIIPAGAVHNAKNTGQGISKVLATYVVDRGKPVATPAP